MAWIRQHRLRAAFLAAGNAFRCGNAAVTAVTKSAVSTQPENPVKTQRTQRITKEAHVTPAKRLSFTKKGSRFLGSAVKEKLAEPETRMLESAESLLRQLLTKHLPQSGCARR